MSNHILNNRLTGKTKRSKEIRRSWNPRRGVEGTTRSIICEGQDGIAGLTIIDVM